MLVLKKDNVLVLKKCFGFEKKDNVLVSKKDNVLVLGRTMYGDQGTGVPGYQEDIRDQGTGVPGYQGRNKNTRIPSFKISTEHPPSDFHEMSRF